MGSLDKVDVPPVRLIALSDRKAVTASFERKIWPNGMAQVIFGNLQSQGGELGDRLNDWDGSGNGSGGLDEANDESNLVGTTENWTEIPGTRETMTNRLYPDPDNQEVYVEVEQIIYLECQDSQGRTFKLRMLNGVSNS
ncbi:MAG: hypothetical protein G8237_12280 [Magnetococcales bacterium]|nr:hypothetical protein [Magnetococcales bacterium]